MLCADFSVRLQRLCGVGGLRLHERAASAKAICRQAGQDLQENARSICMLNHSACGKCLCQNAFYLKSHSSKKNSAFVSNAELAKFIFYKMPYFFLPLAALSFAELFGVSLGFSFSSAMAFAASPTAPNPTSVRLLPFCLLVNVLIS